MKLRYLIITLSLLSSVQQTLSSYCSNGYFYSYDSLSCIECPGGFYKNWIGTPNTCTQCPTGKTSAPGSSECTNIPTQSACSSQASYCSSTGGGYQSGIGGGGGGTSSNFRRLLQSNTCHCCQGEKLVSNTCQSCDLGKYTNLLYHTNPSCINCPAGTYSYYLGAAICTNCVAGKYSAQTAGTSVDVCLSCPLGKFSNAQGAAECTACDLGKYSTTLGATSDTVCNDCMSVYNMYTWGQVLPFLGDTCFSTCAHQNCLMSAWNDDIQCGPVKAVSHWTATASPRTYTIHCRDCPVGHTRMFVMALQYNLVWTRRNYYCVLCTNGPYSISKKPSFVIVVEQNMYETVEDVWTGIVLGGCVIPKKFNYH